MNKKILDDPVGGRVEREEFDKVLDDMSDDIWLENWEPFIEKYISMFGVLPSINNFYCTRSEYTHALLKALDEKKDISKYLKGI